MLLYSNVNFGLHFVKKRKNKWTLEKCFPKLVQGNKANTSKQSENIANDYLWYNPDITIDKETIFFNNYFDYGI